MPDTRGGTSAPPVSVAGDPSIEVGRAERELLIVSFEVQGLVGLLKTFVLVAHPEEQANSQRSIIEEIVSAEEEIISLLVPCIDEGSELEARLVEQVQHLHSASWEGFGALHLDSERIKFTIQSGKPFGSSEHLIGSIHKSLMRLYKQRAELIETSRSIILSDVMVGQKVMPTNPEQSTPLQKITQASGRIPWPELVQRAVDASGLGQSTEHLETYVADFYPERIERLRALGVLAERQRDFEKAKDRLDQAVEAARNVNASWDDVGQVVGITAVSATRRWDPDARRRHSAYRRGSAPPEKPA